MSNKEKNKIVLDEKEDNNAQEANGVKVENDTKQKEKRAIKKGFRYLLYAALALGIVLGGLYMLKQSIKEEKFDFRDKAEGVYFFPVDYKTDIEADPAYMAKNRDVWFSDDKGVGTPLEPGVASQNSIKGLMYRYFKSLMDGDASAHSDLLSKGYKENFVVQDKFTPQKVHDISINFLQGEKRDGVNCWHYKVVYEIYENNGTYRADIGSEVAKVMNFEIVMEDDVYKINSIGYITLKENNNEDDIEESEE